MSASHPGAAVLGEALIDLLPDGDDGYRGRVGGSPANVAVALARLGVATTFLGRTSTDRWGVRIRAHLRDNGVDLDAAPVGDEPTAMALVELGPSGDATYRFLWEGTADRCYELAELPQLPDGAILHVGSLGCVLSPGADALLSLVEHERGRRLISLDPNIRPGLMPPDGRDRLLRLAAMADIVKASAEDLAWLADGDGLRLAHTLVERGCGLVAVTDGASGARLIGPEAQAHVASITVTVADTVGAGDTFAAGLIAGLHDAGIDSAARLRAADADALEAAGSLAVRAAAITVSRTGADPPTRAEL